MLELLQDDFRRADLDAATLALLEFSERLTEAAWQTTTKDITRLREHGFDDEAIHDAVQIVGYFNYINRVCDGLGVELEDFMPSKPDDWERKVGDEKKLGK